MSDDISPKHFYKIAVDILKKKGFPEETAKEQIGQLSEIILLATVQSLLEKKCIKPSVLTDNSAEERLAFLRSLYTDQEIQQELVNQSEIQLRDYFKAISE